MFTKPVLLLFTTAICLFGQAGPPRFTSTLADDYGKFRGFVAAFFKSDRQASELLNPSNRAIYAEGFRPIVGVRNDPDAKFGTTPNLGEYFCRKLYLDFTGLKPMSKEKMLLLTDYIGAESDKTIIEAGGIVEKYHLQVQGPFKYREEFAKVRDSKDLKHLKTFWLNDAILGTELRMLAWMYQSLYGEPYRSVEDRK